MKGTTTMYEQKRTEQTDIWYSIQRTMNDSEVTAREGAWETSLEAQTALGEHPDWSAAWDVNEIVCVTRTVTTVTQIESLPVGATS
jgi:hypothetical protein